MTDDALRTHDGLVEVTHETTGVLGWFNLNAKLRDGLPVWEVWRDDTYTLTEAMVDGAVIDGGAHVGAFSILAAALGAARVLAFEPHPATFARLRDNITLNNREAVIDAEPYALWPTHGIARITGSDCSAHVVDLDESPSSTALLVTTTTLEEAIRSACDGGGEVACVKLDIEGGEYDVLGAVSDDWLGRVRHLVMEFHGSGNGPPSVDPVAAGAALVSLVGRLAEVGQVHVVGRPSVGGMLRWDRYE